MQTIRSKHSIIIRMELKRLPQHQKCHRNHQLQNRCLGKQTLILLPGKTKKIHCWLRKYNSQEIYHLTKLPTFIEFNWKLTRFGEAKTVFTTWQDENVWLRHFNLTKLDIYCLYFVHVENQYWPCTKEITKCLFHVGVHLRIVHWK